MISRSAKMKLITPPKLMPPFHSTTASGMLPTEHTNVSIAITGPMIGPQTAATAGSLDTKSVCQKLFGTHAASAPAIRKPSARSWAMLAISV